MTMKLFNFYLDDETKEIATEKIESICGKREKGQFASLLRVLIKLFVNTEDSTLLSQIAKEVEDEYKLSTKKNKRSRM